MSRLKDRIKQHEGKSYTVYIDSVGLRSVGYGRCIDRVPFSQDEIDLMFENDFRRAQDAAETFFVYSQLNRARRGVLVEMCYQMGPGGVETFAKFLDAAMAGDYDTAADEMLDSKWARQTPARARALAKMFREGV